MATHVSLILKSEPIFVAAVRAASTQTAIKDVKHYPMVVLGGGAGGCSVAARACRMLDKGSVAVVDSAQVITVELQWLKHFWNHENMFETRVVRPNKF